MSAAELASRLGPRVAKSVHDATGNSPSLLGGLFGGNAPPADLVAKCHVAVLALTVHEVVKCSHIFSPTDPGQFQNRFVSEILRCDVADGLERMFLDAVNADIGDYRELLNGRIDNAAYMARISSRLVGLDPLEFMPLTQTIPIIAEYVKDVYEALNHGRLGMIASPAARSHGGGASCSPRKL